MTTIGIKNGTIVTGSDIFLADILIENEIIKGVGHNILGETKHMIDAQGHYVFPGAIDAHTHLDLPFMGTSSSDDFMSGTRAALFGGTTSIIDFAFQSHGKSLQEGLYAWHEKARGKALCDYGFHLAVTDFNEKVGEEIGTLVSQEGVSSFKAFMAYKNALMIDDRQLIGLMDEVKKWRGLVMVHAENGDLADALVQKHRKLGLFSPRYHALSRPEIVEAEATGRAIDIAYAGNHPIYIVHMTSEHALDRVRQAGCRNQQVLVETCPQYLLLDDSLYEKPGFEGAKWVMSPPLRKKKDQEALWNGLKQGMIHCVATDHCPFCLQQKQIGIEDFSHIPNGAPGIEHRLELMFSEGVLKNRLTLNRLIEVCSLNPAKIFGLYPKKGSISVGSDADLVIFNPEEKHTISVSNHHMNCDYSAYEGFSVRGKVKTVLLRGKIAIKQNECTLPPGFGRYLYRKASEEHR